MRSVPLLLATLLPLVAPDAHARCPADPGGDPVVELRTSLGTICVQLLPDAPGFSKTVANFLGYVNRGDYDGTFIHRSVPGSVVQGGGFAFEGGEYRWLCADGCTTVGNEFAGVSDLLGCGPGETLGCNVRGTLAMAQAGGDPDSATSQWFINLDDANRSLDGSSFTVFGNVVSGMDVVDAIAGLPRTTSEFAQTVLTTELRVAFGELPLTSLLPPSCFSLSDLAVVLRAGQTQCASANLEPDPVTGSVYFASPACFGSPALCPVEPLELYVCGVLWLPQGLVFDGLPSSPSSCAQREASDLARAALDGAVSERLVGISRAFVVPEPGPTPAALTALAALALVGGGRARGRSRRRR